MNKNKDLIIGGATWLAEMGVLSDFHKNTLVFGVHQESKSIKEVDFFVFPKNMCGVGENGLILICLKMSRWFLLFGNKKKLTHSLYAKCKNFLPQYEYAIRFSLASIMNEVPLKK